MAPARRRSIRNRAVHGACSIVFTRPGSADRAKRLLFLEATLADEVLKKHDDVLKFCDGLGRGHSLLKAASYLMHGPNFDLVKNYILTHSDLIVEDDSGIPFRAFDPEKWQLGFCGQYKGTINLFKKGDTSGDCRPDLAAAWEAAAQPGAARGFLLGNQWQPKTSGLIEARPK